MTPAQAPAPATQTLAGLAAAPAQTWNWLKINQATLAVPEKPSIATEYIDAYPGLSNLPCGLGNDAEKYLESAASDRSMYFVGKDMPSYERTFVVDASLNAVSDVLLELEESAHYEATVIVTGGEEASGLVGNTCHVRLGAHANLTLNLLVAVPQAVQALQGMGVHLDEGATLTVRQYLLGGGHTVCGFEANLAGTGASMTLETRYVAGRDEQLDCNYVVSQRGKNTQAHVGATGVLTANAHKSWRASIDLIRGCKGSHGSESECVLMAGDDVVNRTLPTILCSEDDVAGDHGATIGSMSEDQRWYLASRGLNEEDIIELFANALVDDAAGTLNATAGEAVAAWATWARGEEAAANAREAAQLARENAARAQARKEAHHA
jgi:Fe-S cluster assembly scaffold protein SufB